MASSLCVGILDHIILDGFAAVNNEASNLQDITVKTAFEVSRRLFGRVCITEICLKRCDQSFDFLLR